MQATQGLKKLHENRIIHRDIKPANIFLTADDKIKLGDLGISKNISQFENNTDTFTLIGSRLYMSPEMLKGDYYSFNADIWSLGCVVYELLFLKTPFLASNDERNTDSLDFNDSILTAPTKK